MASDKSTTPVLSDAGAVETGPALDEMLAWPESEDDELANPVDIGLADDDAETEMLY